MYSVWHSIMAKTAVTQCREKGACPAPGKRNANVIKWEKAHQNPSQSQAGLACALPSHVPSLPTMQESNHKKPDLSSLGVYENCWEQLTHHVFYQCLLRLPSGLYVQEIYWLLCGECFGFYCQILILHNMGFIMTFNICIQCMFIVFISQYPLLSAPSLFLFHVPLSLSSYYYLLTVYKWSENSEKWGLLRPLPHISLGFWRFQLWSHLL